MSDKPIIFSGPMVRALLDGRKTQTRRRLSPDFRRVAWSDPDPDCATCKGNPFWGKTLSHWVRCPTCVRPTTFPYAPGDRLYVREAWSHTGAGVWSIADARRAGRGGVLYRANHEEAAATGPRVDAKWWPSIHMPREFSRLTLTVTDVRVQRLQEISEEDAEAEGVFRHVAEHSLDKVFRSSRSAVAIEYFRDLWNSLHGPDAWAANPWVVALTFTVARRNIDEAQT